MEDERLERIRVTVYENSSWENNPDAKVDFEGLFLGYTDEKKEWLEIIKDSGKRTQGHVKFTKFHIDTVFRPSVQNDPLNFKGKRVICNRDIDGKLSGFPATFVKFSGDNGIIILDDDGQFIEVHVNDITMEMEEKIEDGDNFIQKRLKSI